MKEGISSKTKTTRKGISDHYDSYDKCYRQLLERTVDIKKK